MRREPSDVAILAARIMRAWPSLSPYSCASLADDLCAIERAQRRHAERQCSGEDGGYVKARALPKRGEPGFLGSRWAAPVMEHDPEAEYRAGERIKGRIRGWLATVPETSAGPLACIELQNDPRGRVLLLRLPGEQEASTV